jgi:hypothetical protein
LLKQSAIPDANLICYLLFLPERPLPL